MSLEDELEPKLNELWHAGWGWGSVVQPADGSDPDDMEINRRMTIQHNEPRWAWKDSLEFNDSLVALCGRFRKFYGLDRLDLTLTTAALGSVPTGNTVIGETGDNVAAMIDQAKDPWMARVGALIDEHFWVGDGATRFEENFLSPFGRSAEQQIAYAHILAAISTTYYETLTRGLDNLKAVADATIIAFHSRGGDIDSNLTLAGLLLDIVGFIPVVGTYAGILALAKDIYEAVKSAQAAHAEHHVVVDPDDPIGSANMKLDEIERYFTNADVGVRDKLTEYLHSEKVFASPNLEVRRPPVADSGNAFRRSTLSGKNLVTELTQLYEAGYRNMPAAAARYYHALELLGIYPLPANMAMHPYFPLSTPLFVEAWDKLRTIISDTTDNLIDAGVKMVTAAKTYHMTDDESAARIREFDMIDPPAPLDLTPPAGTPHNRTS